MVQTKYMSIEQKISLAKEIAKYLSQQGVTIEDAISICEIVKKIASKSKIQLDCIDAFNNWFD